MRSRERVLRTQQGDQFAVARSKNSTVKKKVVAKKSMLEEGLARKAPASSAVHVIPKRRAG